MGSIARNSIVVTVVNTLGTLLVLLSNVVIAYRFGAGKDMDVYFAATALPFFVITILSMTLNFTFIPVFTEYEKRGKSDTWDVVSSFMNASVIVATVICVAGMLFSKKIMALITPGFDAAKLDASAGLMALLFPAVILSVVNELLSSIYYAHNKFVTPSLNKILNPLITIIYVLAFGTFLSTKSLALSVVTAYLIQNIFLIAGFLRNKDFAYSLSFHIRHPEVARIFKLMTPLIAAMLISKIAPLTDRFFLSGLAEGSISHVSYAYRITLRIIDSIASGLIVAIFPAMAAQAALLDYERLYRYILQGVRMLFFVIIPFVPILFLYGEPLIRALFQRGMFTAADTGATYKAFAVYLLSLPAVTAASVFYKGFYSVQRNTTVAVLSVAITLGYIGLCYGLLRPCNYLAIPLAHVIAFNTAAVVSGLLLRRSLKITTKHGTGRELAKNACIAVAAALLIMPAMQYARHNTVLYGLLCAAGLMIYYVLSAGIGHVQAAGVLTEHIRAIFRKRHG